MHIEDYHVFFFDLDGLLIDTEPLFYRAFLEACAEASLEIPWDFPTYYRYSSLGREQFSRELVLQFPQAGGCLAKIFERRYQIYEASLVHGVPPLMPGVEEFLERLSFLERPLGVVTNSPGEAVMRLLREHAVFKLFSFWVTRECYSRPKPYGDSYRYAYQRFAFEGARIVGFEDSLKGLRALASIPATMVAVSPLAILSQETYPEFASREFFFYTSFCELMQQCGVQKKL